MYGRGMALPSLEVIGNEVSRERDRQLSHFERMDTKAGIILGLAGAVAALSSRGSPGLASAAAIGASSAA